jgi:hypothetical protein
MGFISLLEKKQKKPYLICSPTPVVVQTTPAPPPTAPHTCHRPAALQTDTPPPDPPPPCLKPLPRLSLPIGKVGLPVLLSGYRSCTAFPAHAPLPSVPKVKSRSNKAYPRGPDRICRQTEGPGARTGRKSRYTGTYHRFTGTRIGFSV